MANDADWYARHLGGGPGRTPPPAPGPPSQSPYYQVPQGYQPPPGYRLVPEYQAPEPYYYQAPGAGHDNPWQEPPPPPVDTSRIPRGAINPTNFLELAAFWRGGRGKNEAQHCPRCDGILFRRFEGRREAAPLCEKCGWNGLWDQGEHAHTAA